MSSRNLDLGLAASNGITVLPDVTTLPAVNQVLAVTQIAGNVVRTAFVNPPPASDMLPLTGGTLTGPLIVGTGASATTTITQSATNVQPTTDHIYNEFTNVVSYTANGTNGDSLGIVSYMGVRANGHSVPNTASQHTTALYGNGYLDADGNAASSVAQVSGVMGVVGNSGPGTLTNGMAFYGHSNYNTGGGHITNSYFLYEEPSSAAQNHYNYLSAPLGIGLTAPQYNIDINMQGGGNINFNNALRIDFSANGTFLVGRNGASFYPGYNPGPGGLGVTDMVVGYNGAPNAVNATTSFLYISACPGTPTGAPAIASSGRVALTFDTSARRLWAHDGTGWAATAPTLSTPVLLTAQTSSTYVVPAGVTRLCGTVVGGGGGGGGVSAAAATGSSGNSGIVNEFTMVVTPGQSIAYQCGAGGTRGANTGGNGGVGGDTTFGPITAKGGAAGAGSTSGNAANTAGLLATNARNGSILVPTATAFLTNIPQLYGGAAGAAGVGGAAAGMWGISTPGTNGSATDATGYGAGGSGAGSTTNTAGTGGAGAPGCIILY